MQPQDVAGIEYELTLLSRHFVQAGRRSPDLTLDRSGYLLLGRLEREAPMSLKELADAFRLDVSTVNRQVAALLRKDLVERMPDPDCGPAHKVRATDAGLAHLRRDRELMRAGLEQVVGEWDTSDTRMLHRLLAMLNSGIESLEGNAWPRP